jgi:hypothetical protein
MRGTWAAIVPAALSLCLGASAAQAQLAVSVNDGKIKLVDGKIEVRKTPQPDTVAIIDMRANPPKILAQIDVPGSVVGPPLSVAVSPKEDIALVTSARRIDPSDPTRQIPDDRVSVIDLTPLKPGFQAPRQRGRGVQGSSTDTEGDRHLAGRQGGVRRIHQQGGHSCLGGEPRRGDGVGVLHQRQHRHACR